MYFRGVRLKNRIELYNDDCLEVLKTIKSNSVDLVLIDPPYEISRSSGFKNGGDSSKYGNFDIDFGEWDYNFDIMEQVVKECYRVWLDLLAVQVTLKNLLQHHSSKASILRCSAFFTVQL